MLQRTKAPRLASGLAVCAVLVAGCGGAGSGSGGMSPDAAEALAGQLSRASTVAVLNSQALGADPGAQALARARSGEGVSCTSDGSSCTYNISVSQRVNCTAGGAINVSGNLTGSMNRSGTGLLQIQVTETITDWQCIGDYVINGDPYISMVGQFSYLNGQPATSQNLTITGGFKWGTSSDESCQIYLSTNFSSGGHGTTTGTVCGYSVSASF